MKNTIYILISLISFSGFAQGSNNAENPNRILLYGLISHQKIKAMEFAAQEYDIKIKVVAGCIVTHKLFR